VTADGAPPAGFVGTVPGAFDVTDRGSAQYTIPIEVPPGRSIQPELALRYTSSTGNGALGVGWSLDGLSVITRCARTFAQDGYSQPVTNTTSDALCLDGQRLVLVSGQDWSHGAEYRTAVDTFDKVVLEHEARYPFTVYKRDGRIFFYGDVDQAGLSDGWPLALVRDRSGNFMRITYRTPEFKSPKLASQANLPGIAKERVPASITYTGFGSTDGDREVRFSYRTRTDKIVGYRPGGTFLSRVFLLEAIEVWAQNQLVRRYALSHEVVNDSTFLKSVQMCAGPTAQACKPPTTFDYYNDELGFGPGEQVALPTHDQNGSVIPEILPYGIVHKSSFATPDELTSLNVTTDVQLVYPIPGGVELALNVVPVAGPWMSRVAGLINQLGRKPIPVPSTETGPSALRARTRSITALQIPVTTGAPPRSSNFSLAPNSAKRRFTRRASTCKRLAGRVRLSPAAVSTATSPRTASRSTWSTIPANGSSMWTETECRTGSLARRTPTCCRCFCRKRIERPRPANPRTSKSLRTVTSATSIAATRTSCSVQKSAQCR
jgi:hypothetical protein